MCDGYQKELVFVTSIASSSSYGTPWRPDSYTKKARQESANNILTLDLGMSTSDQSLQKTAVRNQMIGGVLSEFLATRKSAGWHPDWVTDISSLSRPTVALEVASLSFYTGRLSHGKDIQNELLAQTSLKLYVQGLQAVQKALSNPKLMYREETLAACMLLAMYEVFEGVSESRKAYLTHQDGLAKLIYHRGPEAHQTGLAHSVFLTFRSMSVSNELSNFGTICPLTRLAIDFRGYDAQENFFERVRLDDDPFRNTSKSPIAATPRYSSESSIANGSW